MIHEVSGYEFSQYNPYKPENPRVGLSITSADGEINGLDLYSIPEYRKKSGLNLHETSFQQLTNVYYTSAEVRKLIDPFKNWIARSHILNIKKGGYFPPHRDDIGDEEQVCFRIIVPLESCNPPELYFVHGDNILNWEMGRAYFLNTNITHSLFSFSNNCKMVIMNIICNEKSLNKLVSSFHNV